MSHKLNSHQTWNDTKSETLPKLNCQQNWNVTKTDISPKLKSHQMFNLIFLSVLCLIYIKNTLSKVDTYHASSFFIKTIVSYIISQKVIRLRIGQRHSLLFPTKTSQPVYFQSFSIFKRELCIPLRVWPTQQV